ncbi:MAG: hypothetical protein JSV01_05585 [Desulfobacterales bacterium]|nr:MAG: hypothetical protein JSV01_05585 [Desulfobacterales bacterium]
MEQDYEKELNEIMGSFTCPQDFECYKQRFENICKAEETGQDLLLVCLEKNPSACPLSLNFGDKYYCECSLHIYIAKKLNK